MKKYFMFAAVAGMLASCSSESLTGSDPKIEPTQEDRVPIEINVASAQTKASTRGTGTAGDLASGTNIWNGERVKVLMFKKDDSGNPTFNYAKDGADKNLYDPTISLVTPMTVEGKSSGIAKEPTDPDNIGTGQTYVVKYYPAGVRSDFWGYYLGGYGTGADAPAGDGSVKWYKSVDGNAAKLGAVTTDESEANFAATDFKIDGTHDLLVGKATSTNTDAFSAKAARAGVQPDITFNHLLTRLTFKAEAGNAEAATSQVTVTGIKVHSMTTGKLIAAYKVTPESNIVWDSPVMTDGTTPVPANDYTEYPALTLKKRTSTTDRTITDLTPVPLTWTTEAVPEIIGEALLVAPQAKYYLEIDYTVSAQAARNWYKGGGGTDQYDPGSLTGTATPVAMPTFKTTIPTAESSVTTFEAGKSYEIAFKLFGPQEIEITTTLSAWTSGGTVPVTAD